MLGPDNMFPLADSGPFTGLVAGDTCVIPIGHQDQAGGKTRFVPFWAAMIDVVEAHGPDPLPRRQANVRADGGAAAGEEVRDPDQYR